MTEQERFNQYVYPDPNSGCFIWAGACGYKGYGVFAAGSRKDGAHRTVIAHRYAWILDGRELPPAACLLHKCDTPCCVNPDHLSIGTRADNNRDMALKGRGRKGSGALPFGVVARPSGRFGIVIWNGTRMKCYGTRDTVEEAAAFAEEVRSGRWWRDSARSAFHGRKP